MHAYDQGITPGLNDTDDDDRQSNWDFANSFFFATAVVTTIGYGNLAPSTSLGQKLCLLYAAIGIPLTYTMLASINDLYKNLYRVYTKRLQGVCRCIKYKYLRTTIFGILFCIPFYILLIIIPACIFSRIEGWTFQISHYYTFISLSTIGFGDYVSGYSEDIKGVHRIMYKVALAVYFLFGMSMLSAVFAVIQEMEQKHGQQLEKIADNAIKPSMVEDDDKNGNVRMENLRNDLKNDSHCLDGPEGQ
ncbi:potassium channel, subfamily K, member 16-like [Glandiceps talaboti]